MMATFLSDGAVEPMVVSYGGVLLSAGIELVSGDVRDRVCVERWMSVIMTEELLELPALHEGPALLQDGSFVIVSPIRVSSGSEESLLNS